MKINEIIIENCGVREQTQKDRNSHGSAHNATDKMYNPEAVQYAEDTKSTYEDDSDGTPIFKQEPFNDANENFTTDPVDGAIETSGYRGREMAKARAGIPHKNVRKPEPAQFKPSYPSADGM